MLLSLFFQERKQAQKKQKRSKILSKQYSNSKIVIKDNNAFKETRYCLFMKKLVISMFVFLFALNLVYASPPNPMAFYGEVSYPGGISDGYYITAKIGNVVHGQCLIINNQYGYGENTCIVVSYDSGVLVNFYIGDTLIGNDTFESREIVNLNFTLNSLPPRPPILSNGICEINLGECSFNFLDCQVSLTTACAGNARCDVEIGETCATTPSDCGACPTDSISSTGGSPSSGGINNIHNNLSDKHIE